MILKEELKNGINNVDYIFIDSCDIGCILNDNECEFKKKSFGIIASRMKTMYSSKHDKCSQYIFKK